MKSLALNQMGHPGTPVRVDFKGILYFTKNPNFKHEDVNRLKNNEMRYNLQALIKKDNWSGGYINIRQKRPEQGLLA